MNAKDPPRLAITAFILLLFGYVVVRHYSPAIEQVVVALTMLGTGYWLGSSKGSSDKSAQLEQITQGRGE